MFLKKIFKFIIIKHIKTQLHWDDIEIKTDDQYYDQIPYNFNLFIRPDRWDDSSDFHKPVMDDF